MQNEPRILFSDYFGIDKKILNDYGAYDISLVADLPLFIDPFLLFNSDKPEYQKLHQSIIDYLRFLKEKSLNEKLTPGLIFNLYRFPEVKENWFGFSTVGNKGSALGRDFAIALNENFHKIFNDYGDEKITKSSHLEKLCLVKDGVGKDSISDFTTNLIKEYLLEYTQAFANEHLKSEQCYDFRVPRTRFNYTTQSWDERTYHLPRHRGNFVLLTPKDLLTKDETWINRKDLVEDFYNLTPSITNEELRAKINNYFRNVLAEDAKKKEEKEAIQKTIHEFPVLIDYYIKYKEDRGDTAKSISEQKVTFTEELYLEQGKAFAHLLSKTPFYSISGNSYKEALERVKYMKQVVENNDGYRHFYDKNGNCIAKEEDLKVLYRLTWFGSSYDVNTEVNNGRGPVDTKVSQGAKDASLVEFKLASNSQLERNLKNQVEVYKKANSTDKAIKAIVYFTYRELRKVQAILKRLNVENEESIILIDARRDNKVSASKA